MKTWFCLGAYTEPILFGTGEVFQGKGTGVTICSFEEGRIETVNAVPVRNPSFLCMDEARKRIFAVNEMKEYQGAFGGGVTALSYDEDGRMEILDSLNTGGTDPCHIVLSPDRNFLAVANFASGAVTQVKLSEDGSMNHDRKVFQHEGHSVHPVRQKGPHAHSCIFTPDGKYMLVPDLGLDQVKVYGVKADGLQALPEKDIRVKPGSGPRYGEFTPDGKHFYLINEIGSRIEHYTWDDGRLVLKDEICTLPADFEGENICSDLHITPDGKYLFGSNRGHDSLAVCSIAKDGALTMLGTTPCGGKTPRNFAIDPSGKYILCGNQDSDTIVVFELVENGRLEQRSVYNTGSPVCIRFFEK